jgi:hypothetical protein
MAKAKVEMPLSLQDIIKAEIAQAIAGLTGVPAAKVAAPEVRTWVKKAHKVSKGGFGGTTFTTSRDGKASFGSFVWDDLADQIRSGKL